jgi:hypothetical protein
LTFLSTGEIDLTRTPPDDLQVANTLFSPVISLVTLEAIAQGFDFDFWKVINWYVVSCYWTFLADLGHDRPTIYPRRQISMAPDFTVMPDFSKPMRLPSENNIFISDSLFKIYSTTLHKTIIPLLNLSIQEFKFAPLTDENHFRPEEMTFQRSYDCTVRRWKAPINAIVSILVASYALIQAGYTLVILIAASYEKRKFPEGMSLCDYPS